MRKYSIQIFQFHQECLVICQCISATANIFMFQCINTLTLIIIIVRETNGYWTQSQTIRRYNIVTVRSQYLHRGSFTLYTIVA